MSGDLATLQERYPHGSRWKWRVGWNGRDVGTRILTVVGWHDRSPVFVDHEGRYQPLPDEGESFERIPDPPLCPITEPVMLYRGPDYFRHGWSQEPLGPNYPRPDEPERLTLLPEGVEPPDGLPWAKYTWGTP